MIFITAKFRPLPQDVERWPQLAGEFTRAVRAEEGCLWFEWSRSIEDPGEYVLVEAYRDEQAGAAHVNSAHFKAAQRDLPPHLAQTPRIVSVSVSQNDWSPLSELAVD